MLKLDHLISFVYSISLFVFRCLLDLDILKEKSGKKRNEYTSRLLLSKDGHRYEAV